MSTQAQEFYSNRSMNQTAARIQAHTECDCFTARNTEGVEAYVFADGSVIMFDFYDYDFFFGYR